MTLLYRRHELQKGFIKLKCNWNYLNKNEKKIKASTQKIKEEKKFCRDNLNF